MMYVVQEFSPSKPSGVRVSYPTLDAARHAFREACRRMKEHPELVQWVHLIRRDKLRRIYHLDHADYIPAREKRP